jgi:hypothetical protein
MDAPSSRFLGPGEDSQILQISQAIPHSFRGGNSILFIADSNIPMIALISHCIPLHEVLAAAGPSRSTCCCFSSPLDGQHLIVNSMARASDSNRMSAMNCGSKMTQGRILYVSATLMCQHLHCGSFVRFSTPVFFIFEKPPASLTLKLVCLYSEPAWLISVPKDLG